jgi:hypothetical protein
VIKIVLSRLLYMKGAVEFFKIEYSDNIIFFIKFVLDRLPYIGALLVLLVAYMMSMSRQCR